MMRLRSPLDLARALPHCLLHFPHQSLEWDFDRRARMFRFFQTFGASEVLSNAGTKLWCSVSKTQQESAISGHVVPTKRVVAKFDETAAEGLDFDWSDVGMLGSDTT